jgi:hypothetical protein
MKPIKTYEDVFTRVDWQLLKEQKSYLYVLSTDLHLAGKTEDHELVEGLIEFLEVLEGVEDDYKFNGRG